MADFVMNGSFRGRALIRTIPHRLRFSRMRRDRLGCHRRLIPIGSIESLKDIELLSESPLME
jgi:hypothetical protein